MASKIDPKRIRIDCDTQLRVEMNESVIAEYAEAMERGDEFPAILVFFDEETDEFILVDGFHRYFAHMRAKPNDPILAEQRIGTLEDARWESLAANKSHGLRRSNADKRNAITQALLHPKGASSSNRQIAKHVGVAEATVRIIRDELIASAQIAHLTTRKGLDGKCYPVKSKMQEEEKSSTESCSNCLHFMDSHGECMLDSSQQKPWSDACDEFEILPPEPIRPELQNIPDLPDEYEEIELKKGPRKRNPGQYKMRNTSNLDLPHDNPQVFALELRSRFSDEYLEECFIAVRVLSRTSNEDDPFPNL